MSELRGEALVGIVLALQFAAFGWRINREITVGDQGRRTWVPIPDIFNIASMCAVVVCCVLMPLAGLQNEWLIGMVLSVAYIQIALHPLNVAAHYRLFFTREGRGKYEREGRDWPYITDHEWVSIITTMLLIVIVVAWFLIRQ